MKTYAIKKGHHYSGIHLGLLFNQKSFKFQARFSKECWFDGNDEQLDGQVNKLAGISFGYHHHNSIRIGWNPNLQKHSMNLFLYTYSSGKMEFTWLTDVFCDQLFTVDAAIDDNMNGGKRSVTVHVNSEDQHLSYLIPKPDMKTHLLGYKLYPYFGGKAAAPNDMSIDLDWLE